MKIFFNTLISDYKISKKNAHNIAILHVISCVWRRIGQVVHRLIGFEVVCERGFDQGKVPSRKRPCEDYAETSPSDIGDFITAVGNIAKTVTQLIANIQLLQELVAGPPREKTPNLGNANRP